MGAHQYAAAEIQKNIEGKKGADVAAAIAAEMTGDQATCEGSKEDYSK